MKSIRARLEDYMNKEQFDSATKDEVRNLVKYAYRTSNPKESILNGLENYMKNPEKFEYSDHKNWNDRNFMIFALCAALSFIKEIC